MLVAERRRKEPRQIPRPGTLTGPGGDNDLKVSEEGAVQARGLSGMLSATQMRGAVNLRG